MNKIEYMGLRVMRTINKSFEISTFILRLRPPKPPSPMSRRTSVSGRK